MEPDLVRNPTEVIDAPFQRSGEEIMNTMFSAAEKSGAPGAMIVAENNVNQAMVKEMRAFIDLNKNQQWDKGEDIETYRFKLFVFISKDATYLKTAFDQTAPAANELCIYLEENSEDLFSDAASFIKIGSGLVNDVKRLAALASSEAIRDMAGELGEFNIGYSREDLMELITEGEISNASRTTVIGIMQGLNLVNIALAPLMNLIGSGILALTSSVKPYLTFQDYHWDPAAERPSETTGGEAQGFEPFFFPYSNSLLEMISNGEEQAIASIAQSIQERLTLYRSSISSYLNELPAFQLSVEEQSYGVSTQFIIPLMEKGYDLLDQALEFLKNNALAVIQTFEYMGINMLNAINAFYCGLWNALVNAVLGIIDMLGYIFSFLGAAGEFWANAQEKIPELYELMDEAIQSFLKLDVNKILSEIINQLTLIDLSAIAGSISIERIAYFTGAFVGFLIEMLVGFLFTGGISSVTGTLSKFGSMGTKFYKMAEAGFRKIFVRSITEVSPRSIITMLFHYLQKMIEILKKGTEEILRYVRSIFDELTNLSRLATEVIEEIIKKFNISIAERQLMKKLNIEFMNFENGIATACKFQNK